MLTESHMQQLLDISQSLESLSSTTQDSTLSVIQQQVNLLLTQIQASPPSLRGGGSSSDEDRRTVVSRDHPLKME